MNAEDPGIVLGRGRTVDQLAAVIDARRVPTSEQAEVAGWGTSPALVVAGAGSGKTETLSMRMVYLLDHAREWWGEDVSPDQILCLTFTRKAAAEISSRARERIAAAFGDDAARPSPTVATYNAYAAGLVGEHGLRVGVDPDSVILTDASLWQMASAIVEGWVDDIDSSSAASTIVRAIPALASQLSDHGASPSELAAFAVAIAEAVEAMPSRTGKSPGSPTKAARETAARFRSRAALAPLLEEYARRKREGSFLDFADQIALAGRLARNPAVRAVERSRYRAVLLDEFQDTSHGQLDLFATMFGDRHPVMAVGDPHQAIYGFRGASAASLAAFVDRFGGRDAVGHLTLSTSWRNAPGVLVAANAVTEPLRATARVSVPELRPRDGAIDVVAPIAMRMYADSRAEAAGVVEDLVARRADLQRWREAHPETAREGHPTAAVLCRRRSQFPAIVAALRERGVRYQVVGLGGLLDVPEIVDLVALLEAAHDPSRGDSLMRLLASERFALGAADLAALADYSRELAGPRETREAEPSIVDAIEDLPAPGWVSRDGRVITDAARERIARARAVLATIRAHTFLPLGELVAFAARAYVLDIECAVARDDGGGSDALESFGDVARTFATGAEHATLGAFLAWLAAAREEESGLDSPVATPDPSAVQVQTVHAAKGLEWDIVAVPGLVDGRFPIVDPPTSTRAEYASSGWMKELRELPWPLRRDAAEMPVWDGTGAATFAEFSASVEAFKVAAGRHALEEERRLFYVAITRAFSSVILSGAWWDERKKPQEPSIYVRELVDAGVVSEDGWDPRPDANPLDDNPPDVAPWPPEPTNAIRATRELASAVRAAVADPPAPASSLPYAREIEAMLAEAASSGGAVVATPAHLSATALVALARDRDAFALGLRRPIPSEPTAAAERGSAFHAWVETHFGATPLWDEEDPEAGDDLEALRARFLASPWARRTPSHVEADVELPLAGVTLRSRIDAVFPPGDGLERLTVVDWKTGPPPREPDERAAREVQLAMYRLAWARLAGVPVADVDAVFFYASTGDTVSPDRLLDEEEIVALLGG